MNNGREFQGDLRKSSYTNRI